MKKSILWLALAMTMPLQAVSDSSVNPSKFDSSEITSSTNQDAVSNLSDEEKSLARQWMLTETDWVKYKKIMSGPRGIWSPGLDPLTALGVMETDPEERRRYADIWMKVEIRRSELELAFEVERMAASTRILQGKPVVDNKSWIDDWEMKNNAVTHDVMLFVDASCLENCIPLYKQVFGSIGTAKKAQLNIYFPKSTTAEDIGKWAREMGIDPEIVQSRLVTLNFDEGEYDKYGILNSDLPEVRVLERKTGEVTRTFENW